MAETETPIQTETPPPAGRRPHWPRTALGAALALSVAVGLYTASWLGAAATVTSGIDNWIDAHRQRGIAVSYRDLDVSGFPFWLDIRMAGPVVEAIGRMPMTWRPPDLQGLIRPWRLDRVDVDLSGRHEITGPRPVVLSARRLGLHLETGPRGAADGQLRVTGANADVARVGDVKLDNLVLDFSWRGSARPSDEAPPLGFDFGADGVSLPAAWATPLGREVATLRVVGQVTGPLGDLRDPDLLINWRDAGGSLEVTQLGVDHGPLRIEGNGTFALDTQMQPIGAFTARAEGYMETVDALGAAGLIRPGEATAAKLLLTVLAKRPRGETPHIEAPLTLQDRALSLESLTIARLPVIDWSRLRQRAGL